MMRVFCAPLLALSLTAATVPAVAAAARKDISVSDVALQAPAGWSAAAGARPSNEKLQALAADATPAGTRPRARSLLGFTRGAERAVLYYLEYGSEREAQKALGEVRSRLWGGAEAPEGAPRLLRVQNVVAIIESPTLSLTMAASRRLAQAGAVQDGADLGSATPEEPPSAGPTEIAPPPAVALPDAAPLGAQAADPSLQAQVSAQLGKHLGSSTSCGEKLQQKRFSEALSCYRRFQQEVDSDAGASDLARWDAASGVGLSAAMGGQMAEAREAFLRALKPATRLDPRKLAETYFNFACAEAELGHKPGALQALKGCLGAAKRAGAERLAHYRQSIQSDDSLKSLRGDPRLKKLLAAH